ncbi:hypothetical protein ABPG75_002778 [Micractinium tetrahymenae]
MSRAEGILCASCTIKQECSQQAAAAAEDGVEERLPVPQPGEEAHTPWRCLLELMPGFGQAASGELTYSAACVPGPRMPLEKAMGGERWPGLEAVEVEEGGTIREYPPNSKVRFGEGFHLPAMVAFNVIGIGN